MAIFANKQILLTREEEELMNGEGCTNLRDKNKFIDWLMRPSGFLEGLDEMRENETNDMIMENLERGDK